MMRTIKLIVLGLMAAILIALGVANMAPVDLYLLPPELAGDQAGLKRVPLAAVILAAVLFGIVVGQLLEWLRERKYRAVADEKRGEIARLRQELSRLRAKAAEAGDDLPRIPAA